MMKQLPDSHAFIIDGGTWVGLHRSTGLTVTVFPSAEHPGFFHLHKLDLVAAEERQTRRPVAARGVRVFIETNGIDVQSFEWSKAGAAPRRPRTIKKREPSRSSVYFLRAGDFIKIGKALNTTKRIAELQTGCPHEIQLVGRIDGDVKEEHALHGRFAHLKARRGGEWFHFSGELREYIEAMS